MTWGILGALVAALFGGFCGAIVLRGMQMKKLASEGVVVNGEVVEKQRRNTSTSRRSSPYLRYAYTGPDGQRRELRAAVAESVFDAHAVGDAFDVVCLPGKPQVAGPKYIVNLSREALKLPPL